MSFDLTNKNISDTFQNLLQKTGSDGRLYDLKGNQVRDLVIDGTLTANSYVTSESIVNTSSGSTTFGNSSDDVHQFTGSLSSTGTIGGSNLSGTNTGDQDLSSLALKTSISGSFVQPSSSFSTRVTSLESNPVFSAAGISGSFVQPSSSFSTRVTSLEGNDVFTSAGISGSFVQPSSSFSTRVTTIEGNVGQAVNTTSNVTFNHITASGDISSSGTITANSFVGDISSISNLISGDGNNRVLTSDGDGTFTAESAFKITGGTATFQGLSISMSHGMVVNDGNEDAGLQVKGSSDSNLLRVNSQFNDKIGIGTDNPGEKLTVEGNISASGTGSFGLVQLERIETTTSDNVIHLNGIIRGSGSGEANTILFTGDGGAVAFADSADQNTRIQFQQGVINFQANDASTNQVVIQQGTETANIPSMVIGKSGMNEGDKALQVYGDISMSGQIHMESPGASVHTLLATTGSDSSDPRIGIGTPLGSIPGAALHVEGSISSSGNILLKQGQRISWGEATGKDYRIRGHSTGLLVYSGSNVIHNLLHQPTGNVGIGTDSPGEKLEVVGNISASGDIILGNNKKLTFDNNLSGMYIDSPALNQFDISVGNTRKVSVTGAVFLTSGVTNTLGGDTDVGGHITASGDISSSGGVVSSTVQADSSIVLGTDRSNHPNEGGAAAKLFLDGGSDTYLTTDGENNTIKFFANNNEHMKLNNGYGLRVTGDISSSGNYYIKNTNFIGFSDSGGDNDEFRIFKTANNHTILRDEGGTATSINLTTTKTGGQRFGIHIAGGDNSNNGGVYIGSSTSASDLTGSDATKTLTVEGDISASGNITSDGTIGGSNLSGTNTGDQDLSSLALKTAVSGSWLGQNLISSSALEGTRDTISGSATSTGSFGNLVINGSGQASLFVDGNISGSITSTGSFGRVETTNVEGTLVTAAQTNITSVGALDGGSITSNFGTINNGSSDITTTATGSFGRVAGQSVHLNLRQDDIVLLYLTSQNTWYSIGTAFGTYNLGTSIGSETVLNLIRLANYIAPETVKLKKIMFSFYPADTSGVSSFDLEFSIHKVPFANGSTSNIDISTSDNTFTPDVSCDGTYTENTGYLKKLSFSSGNTLYEGEGLVIAVRNTTGSTNKLSLYGNCTVEFERQ